MSILVIAEHNHATLKTETCNAIAAAIKIAAQTKTDIHVMVAGHACAAVAEAAACVEGVRRVIHVEAPHYADQTAENLAALIVTNSAPYTHVLAPATSHGKNVLPRVAALLDVAQVSDVIDVEDPETFVRPIYAGNALATVRSNDAVKVLTVRTTAFQPASTTGGAADVVELAPATDLAMSRLKRRDLTQSGRPELSAASIVVSGGRGLGSGENYRQILEPLADKIGAALGASRAAVDAGFVPNDYQVGQTGKVVAPQLYIAVGISGAIQHLAGMKDSKVIVAINKDPDAPIFQVADYGLVADLFHAVPELTDLLR